MRDLARIDELLSLFKEYWLKYPDLRFFQVLESVGFKGTVDYFYTEDDVVINLLRRANEWDSTSLYTSGK